MEDLVKIYAATPPLVAGSVPCGNPFVVPATRCTLIYLSLGGCGATEREMLTAERGKVEVRRFSTKFEAFLHFCVVALAVAHSTCAWWCLSGAGAVLKAEAVLGGGVGVGVGIICDPIRTSDNATSARARART